jgi:alkanesulfonate monooxygenase SsuD/methylene tetrahydromethanopterin reductase-like flavin-dependent oxidoreductase (luciferase family)
MPFPGSTERWERFEEALDYLTAAFDPGHSRHQGRYYHLDANVTPKPIGLRIIIGGSGSRRTPRLAGAKADEYNFFVCPPEEAKSKIETMRESEGDRHVEATVMGPVVVGRTGAEYRARLARFAERFGNGRRPDELDERWKGSGMIYGTADQAVEAVAALEAVGVERTYLQWLDLADFDGLAATVDMLCG